MKRNIPGENGLVAAILRGIRPDLRDMRAETRAEFRHIKVRLSAFEAVTGQLLSLDAAKSQRLDRLEDRVGQIERRLEMARDGASKGTTP